MLTRLGRFLTKKVVKNYKSNYDERCGNLSISHYLIKIHNPSKCCSVRIAAYVDNIARTKSLVNITGSDVIKAAPSHTTAKFEQIAENTLKCGLPISKEDLIYTYFNKKGFY